MTKSPRTQTEREAWIAALRDALTSPVNAAAPEAVKRTPNDFAIEHAEYMATTAERLLTALNAEDEVRQRREESDDVAEDDVYDAGVTRSEYVSALRGRIHEFRKRRDRAASEPVNAAPAGEPQPVLWIARAKRDSEETVEGELSISDVAEKQFELYDPDIWECIPLYTAPAASLRDAEDARNTGENVAAREQEKRRKG